MYYIRITSLQLLDQLLQAGISEFITTHGILRCSRIITLRRSARLPYHIYSLVDDSACNCSRSEMEQLFGEAIRYGCFWAETSSNPQDLNLVDMRQMAPETLPLIFNKAD